MFTLAERRALLSEYFRLVESLRELDMVEARAPEQPRTMRHARLYAARTSELWDRYIDGLPFVALSRCPITGAILHHSLDPLGIDGLWWRYLGAARPVEDVPPTFYALAGAMELRPPIESAPFVAMPGPGAAYVVPRLFDHPGVVAVLSAVLVGPHRGLAIAYFAPPATGGDRVNAWGTNEYVLHGRGGWNAVDEDAGSFDFDLEPWIERGRVRWIEPGDEELTLRDAVRGCPFLDSKGTRRLQWIREGRLT